MRKIAAGEPEKNSWSQALKMGLPLAGGVLPLLLIVPKMLSETGMNFAGVYTATALTICLGALVAAYYKLPYLIAPSYVITAWLVYIAGVAKGIAWQQLLGLNLVVSLLSLLLLKIFSWSKIMKCLPLFLLQGLPVGLGLMLIVMGLQLGRVVISSPTTVTMLGNFQDPLAYFGTAGIIIMLVLMVRQITGWIFWSMLVTALLALFEGFWVIPDAPFFLPEGLDKTVLALTFSADTVKIINILIETGLTLFLLLATINFTVSKAIADNDNEKAEKILSLTYALNSLGAILGSPVLIVSPLSAANLNSSKAGHKIALVIAAFMLLALFIEPIAASLADFSVMLVPVLVGIGIMLIKKYLNCAQAAGEDYERIAQLTLWLMMILSMNMAAAVGAALGIYCLLATVKGRYREIPAATWFITLLYILYMFYGAI